MTCDQEIVTINQQNSAYMRQALTAQNAFMHELLPCHYSLAEIEESDQLGWQTAYVFALETLDLLGHFCLNAIDNGDFASASLTFAQSQSQYQFVEYARRQKLIKSQLDYHYADSHMEHLLNDCSVLSKSLCVLQTADISQATGIITLIGNIIDTAKAAAYMAAGKLPEYFSDAYIAQIIKKLTAAGDQSCLPNRYQALYMVAPQLEQKTPEMQKLYLLHFSRMYHRADAPAARKGASIAARQDLKIARALVLQLQSTVFKSTESTLSGGSK